MATTRKTPRRDGGNNLPGAGVSPSLPPITVGSEGADVAAEVAASPAAAPWEETASFAHESARPELGGLVAMVQDRARSLTDRLAREVREHPVRSLAIAGVIGFIVASSMKYRIIPAMLRTGAGIAAAIAMRDIAERGLGRNDAAGSVR